ncbi:hypothetical protein [Amycolatopsis sp. NPDC004625]
MDHERPAGQEKVIPREPDAPGVAFFRRTGRGHGAERRGGSPAGAHGP